MTQDEEDQEIYEATIKWDKFFGKPHDDVLRLPTRREQLTAETLNSIPDFFETIIDLLDVNRGGGGKIEAIKYVRLSTNLGLKEAKDFVDEFQEKNGLTIIYPSVGKTS
jgi:hypothetical protein